jgi:hypothetical protein
MLEIWIGWEGVMEPSCHRFETRAELVAFCKGVKVAAEKSRCDPMFYRTRKDAMEDVDSVEISE